MTLDANLLVGIKVGFSLGFILGLVTASTILWKVKR